MKRLVFPMIGMLLMLGLFTSPTSLEARESEVRQEDRSLVQTTKMILDCNNLTESAEEYAHSQGWCLDDNEVTPNGTTVGDCGSASIFMFDDPFTAGVAKFDMAIFSSKGRMINVNWNVNWLNWSGGAGSFGGTDWQNSATWSKSALQYTAIPSPHI